MESEQLFNYCKKFYSLNLYLLCFLCVLLTGCFENYSRPSDRRATAFETAPYRSPVQIRQNAPSYPPYQYRQPYYYGPPNSRLYYNPYDFQQPYGSNPYSDYDQYYVPPVEYYNNEYDNGSSFDYSGGN